MPDNRAQTNLIGVIIGVTISAIVGVGVVIPLILDVIESASLSGITQTVVGFIPVMVALLVFVAAASPVMRSTQ
jgi:hypothetical protein